jgi:hypothetical protein
MTGQKNTFGDFWVWAFSLALAVLIWKTVDHAIHLKIAADPNLASRTERTFSGISIAVIKDAADIHSFRVTPARVDVTVSVPPALQGIKDKDIEVYVNLKDVQDATALRKRVQVVAPPEVIILRVTPPDVSVDVIHVNDPNSNPNK